MVSLNIGSTLGVLAPVATLLCLYGTTCLVSARLTEVRTERLPILAHNLHTFNVDLDTLSTRAGLGPRSSFRYKNGHFHKTSKGGLRVRLVQTYAGYEVVGPTAVAETDNRGLFTGQLYGELARNLHKDIPNPESCLRNVRALLKRVVHLEKLHLANPTDIDKTDGRRVILADPEKRKAKIVYVVEFFYTGNGFFKFPVYFIDACSNSVLFHFDKVKNATIPDRQHPPNKIVDVLNPSQQQQQNQRSAEESRRSPPSNDTRTSNSKSLRFQSESSGRVLSSCTPSAVGVGGNDKTGQVTYNTFPDYCLPVSESAGTCTMDSDYAKVVDNENTKSETRNTAISFTCSTGFSDSINGAFGVATDALFYGHASGDFFETRYGKKALSKQPRMVVHYGENLGNAFWTGEDMFFGDGNDDFYPFTVLDIIAHELAHGFTVSNSNLIYLLQMGGIDEAFSDITAVATRKYVTGETDWQIGADVYKESGKAIRYMNDPPKDGRSIKKIWRYYPFMNVHYSSGVFNYAFYNLIESEDVDMYDGFDDFYVANRDLWGRLTRFRKGACNVVQASYDNGNDHEKVEKAFKSTGIGFRRCSHDALKATVFPGETRKGITVKKDVRSPVLEVDMRRWRGTAVTARCEGGCVSSTPIGVVMAADPRFEKVLVKGYNRVEIPSDHANGVLYVRLTSSQEKEVKVTMHVLQRDNK